MSRRANFMMVVAGSNITSTLAPVLISLTVSDKVGTHTDTATIEVDDTGGRIALPAKGAPVVVALGWDGEGMRPVFTGTVDEVRSSGSRGGGRTVSITAKGMDTTKKPKEAQQRHFDGKTVKDIISEAGQAAGVTDVEIDPSLASIPRAYFEMRDESFIHMGERLAREIGGNFRVHGSRAVMSKRGGAYTAAVVAAWGRNLHSWDITPTMGRTQYKTVRARWYDKAAAGGERQGDVGAGRWRRLGDHRGRHHGHSGRALHRGGSASRHRRAVPDRERDTQLFAQRRLHDATRA
jgi:phage protein D